VSENVWLHGDCLERFEFPTDYRKPRYYKESSINGTRREDRRCGCCGVILESSLSCGRNQPAASRVNGSKHLHKANNVEFVKLCLTEQIKTSVFVVASIGVNRWGPQVKVIREQSDSFLGVEVQRWRLKRIFARQPGRTFSFFNSPIGCIRSNLGFHIIAKFELG